MLKAIVKFFKALNKNSHPGEIAHAVCCGMILGFLPKDNALWYILAVLFIFLRMQKSAFLIFTLIFTLASPFFDSLFDTVGYFVLKTDFLQPLFVFLIKIPLVGYTRFYNSIVMGSLLCSLLLYIPLYFISKAIIQLWRNKMVPLVRKTRLVKIVSKLPLVSKIKEVM